MAHEWYASLLVLWIVQCNDAGVWLSFPGLATYHSFLLLFFAVIKGLFFTKRQHSWQWNWENIKYNSARLSTGFNSFPCDQANCPGPWPRLWTYKMLFVLFVSTRSPTWSQRWITWPVPKLSLRWWPCPAQCRWQGSLSVNVTDRKSSLPASAWPVTASVGRKIRVSRNWEIW